MFLQHIYERELAQASYLVGCQATGEAIVIDPRRDSDVYLRAAREAGLTIRYVTETHIHADFLSGARELAAATGAELLLSDEGGDSWQYRFPHRGLHDGDVFSVGRLRFEVWHTPGHTPEHISFLLTDTAAGAYPAMIFTGDFVFVGDVGRPDLLEEAAGLVGSSEPSARQLFASLRRFRTLPDYIQLWPGHGAGSACGKALGAVPASTVGYEKLVNWALQYTDEEAFVRALLSGQPEAPRYFAVMKRLNREGPPLLGKLPRPPRLSAAQALAQLDAGTVLVDTRDKTAFARGHVPGSLHIADNGSFTTWAGWMLSYDRPFLLLAGERRIEDLTRSLIRIGLDNIAGYVTDLSFWTAAGRPLVTLNVITAAELRRRLAADEVVVVDVRNQSEYAEGHIPGAHKFMVGQLPDHLDEVRRLAASGRPLVVHCAVGDRASLAVSYLLGQGIADVLYFPGGMQEWQRAGYPVVNGADGRSG
ncbi:MAG: rhodanese-like domain-containing protein [Gemmataceae bacterium]|nr:rhodanese-like domain-containing protein [Caldilineales bacterium]MDW8264073.1 rhodanese-like domain-containing protein [Gemmataceae bacterium]